MKLKKLSRAILFMSLFTLSACGFVFKSDNYRLVNGGYNVYLEDVSTALFVPSLEETFRTEFQRRLYNRNGLNYVPKTYADIILKVSILKYDSIIGDVDNQGYRPVALNVVASVVAIDLFKEKENTESFNITAESSYRSLNPLQNALENLSQQRVVSAKLSDGIIAKIAANE